MIFKEKHDIMKFYSKSWQNCSNYQYFHFTWSKRKTKLLYFHIFFMYSFIKNIFLVWFVYWVFFDHKLSYDVCESYMLNYKLFSFIFRMVYLKHLTFEKNICVSVKFNVEQLFFDIQSNYQKKDFVYQQQLKKPWERNRLNSKRKRWPNRKKVHKN